MKEVKSKAQFDADFRELSRPVIIDFYAAWCGPCQSVTYLITDEEQMNDDVVFVKVDVDTQENDELVREFSVRSIPTLVKMKDGFEVDRLVGVPKKEDFKEFIDE